MCGFAGIINIKRLANKEFLERNVDGVSSKLETLSTQVSKIKKK